MNVEQVNAYGFERAVMHTEQLAIGKWANLWYVIDMVASGEVGRPSHIGTPTPTRWQAVEQADSYVRREQYK